MQNNRLLRMEQAIGHPDPGAHRLERVENEGRQHILDRRGFRDDRAILTVQFADGAVPVSMQVVDPDYGPMHRVRLVEGVWFTERDGDRLAPAVIVNEAFWKRLGSPPLATHPTVELVGNGRVTGVVTGVTPAQSEWDVEPTAFILTDSFLPLQSATADPMMGAYMPSYEMWIPDGSADELTESVQRAFESELGGGATVDGWRSDYAAQEEDPFLPIKLMVVGVAVVILLLGALGLLRGGRK